MHGNVPSRYSRSAWELFELWIWCFVWMSAPQTSVFLNHCHKAPLILFHVIIFPCTHCALSDQVGCASSSEALQELSSALMNHCSSPSVHTAAEQVDMWAILCSTRIERGGIFFLKPTADASGQLFCPSCLAVLTANINLYSHSLNASPSHPQHRWIWVWYNRSFIVTCQEEWHGGQCRVEGRTVKPVWNQASPVIS